jgi:hypothetical protein
MGTRCCITFVDERNRKGLHVFRHWDGYPEAVIPDLVEAFVKDKTWDLPRYEADEAAAGFIATHKNRGGNYRIQRTWNESCDIEWHFVVMRQGRYVFCHYGNPTGGNYSHKTGTWGRLRPPRKWQATNISAAVDAINAGQTLLASPVPALPSA